MSRVATIIGALAILCGLLILVTYQFGRIGMDYVIATLGHNSPRSIASYTTIDVMLHRALVQYNLSRIGIARFRVEKGQDFFAVFDSMTASPGVSTDITNLQHVPASTLAPVISALLHDETKLEWTRDLPQGALRDLSQTRKAAVVLYAPVQDQNKHLIGMLTATWLDETKVPPEDQRDQMAKDLADIARNVGRYMRALPS